MRTAMMSAAAAFIALAPGTASASEIGTALMLDRDKRDIGTVEFRQTPNGVLISVDLRGLPPGQVAFHIHETGACEGDFSSAGGHFDPDDRDHGYHAESGPHAGDLPNLHVPENGEVRVEFFNAMVTLEEGQDNSLRGGDGTAMVIHADPDDYESQPAGDAGERIVCGVIQ